MEGTITDADLEALALKVEEAARSTEEGVRYFIEPAPGTLRRAVAKRHHVIFGRRGSWKSSLLRKAGADLTVDRRPIAHVNLETYKSHSYPDVLLSVLIATFKAFSEWMRTAAVSPANKTSFWDRLFGTKPRRAAFNRKECAALVTRLDTQVKQLEEQLHSSDSSDMTVTRERQSEASENVGLGAKIGQTSASINAEMKSGNTIKRGESVQESICSTRCEHGLSL